MPLGCVGLVSPVISDAWQRTWGSGRLAPDYTLNVLDCGIGNGFWGLACRQWLAGPGRPLYMMGVEGWEAYRGPAWQFYDYVWVSRIEHYLQRNPHARADRFDVILLLDVLEHFDKPQGHEILRLLRSRLRPGGSLYVGTPAVFIEQGAHEGNELEEHRSLWTPEDLTASHPCEILQSGEGDPQGYRMLLGRIGTL